MSSGKVLRSCNTIVQSKFMCATKLRVSAPSHGIVVSSPASSTKCCSGMSASGSLFKDENFERALTHGCNP